MTSQVNHVQQNCFYKNIHCFYLPPKSLAEDSIGSRRVCILIRNCDELKNSCIGFTETFEIEKYKLFQHLLPQGMFSHRGPTGLLNEHLTNDLPKFTKFLSEEEGKKMCKDIPGCKVITDKFESIMLKYCKDSPKP